MQISFRYFRTFKIMATVFIISINSSLIDARCMRNPFYFSDPAITVPFSYKALAKVHNHSKSFAILSYKSSGSRNVIAHKNDIILGYKIVDIQHDMIIVQDDKDNEVMVPLQ